MNHRLNVAFLLFCVLNHLVGLFTIFQLLWLLLRFNNVSKYHTSSSDDRQSCSPPKITKRNSPSKRIPLSPSKPNIDAGILDDIDTSTKLKARKSLFGVANSEKTTENISIATPKKVSLRFFFIEVR